jgi:patatin-like phospholipase/acyl hydrolase
LVPVSAPTSYLISTRGGEVFPPVDHIGSCIRRIRRIARYRYDTAALRKLLEQTLGDKLFGDSCVPLCIPAFEGHYSEVFVFKTPHHPDYQTDRQEFMVNVGLATAAAPTYFRPLDHGGYRLVDGGVWANNPVMLAVVEALTCYTVGRDQIDVLSISCGDDPYVVSEMQTKMGGLWHWQEIIVAAMRLQSLAATNQARLLLGPPNVVRVDLPAFELPIEMDDWRRSVDLLVPAAEAFTQLKVSNS